MCNQPCESCSKVCERVTDLDVAYSEVAPESVKAGRALFFWLFEKLGINTEGVMSVNLVMESGKAAITVKRFMTITHWKPVTMQLLVEQFEVFKRIQLAALDVPTPAETVAAADRFEVVKTSETTESITPECVERVVGSPTETLSR